MEWIKVVCYAFDFSSASASPVSVPVVVVGFDAAKREDAAQGVPHRVLLYLPSVLSLAVLSAASLVHELGLALKDHFGARRNRFFVEVLVILDVADVRVRFVVLPTVLSLEVETGVCAASRAHLQSLDRQVVVVLRLVATLALHRASRLVVVRVVSRR